MKKLSAIFILILLVLLNTIFSFSQPTSQSTTDSKSIFWNNVQFGGGLSLGISSTSANIGISPSAIYNFKDNFSAGISLLYLYSKYKNVSKPLNVYGASVITLFNPIEELQISGEYEMNFLRQGNASETIPALYLGVGYMTGKSITAGVRYNVLYNENISLYESAITPFVRIYFN